MKSTVKTVIAIFCFLLFLSHLQAQNTAIDSLQNELLLHIEKDTIRVNLLNALAYSYRKKDTEKAMAMAYLEESEAIAEAIGFIKGRAKSLYARGVLEAVESNYRRGFPNYTESLELYKNIAWKEGIAECYKEMGVFMYNNGDQREAIKYYTKSLEILDEYGKKKEIALILYEMGWSYLEIDDYTDARAHLFKALKINKKIGNEAGMSSCMSGIAVTYSNQGNYPVALDFYSQTLAIAKKNSNTRRTMLTLGNMGSLYFSLKEYDKAIELYNETLRLTKNTDKGITSKTFNNLGLAYKEKKDNKLAYEYIKKALNLFNEVNDRRGEAFALNNIGYIYLETKDYTKAHEYYEQAKKLCLEIENRRGLCIAYLGLARVYYQKQNYDEALINALKSKKLSEKHELLQYQSDVQELLSKIYKNTSNYKKAFESHQQLKKLNDSLFNKENIEKIAQLEYEYKYKQALDSASIRELKLTKTVTVTNRNLEKSQRNYLWAIIGVLLVSILLGSIIFYQKYRNEKSKTQNIIVEQKLLRSQMTPHFIFNSLSVLQGMILNKEEKKSISYLSKFSKLLRTTLENSRHKTVALSEELSAIDSYMALQNLDVNPPFNYNLSIDSKIDTATFNIPPMLIQPFIENAIEHAFVAKKENKEIKVKITLKDNTLVCAIADNGKGVSIDMPKINKNKKSLATTITAERLIMLSKDFKVEGSVRVTNRELFGEQGTLVTLVIPYKIDSDSQ